MKIILKGGKKFEEVLNRVCSRGSQQSGQVEKSVRSILQSVQRSGDRAVSRFALKFDRIKMKPADFRVGPDEMKAAHALIRKEEGDALRFAAGRIRTFHERQRKSTWTSLERGVRLGQLVTPLDAVGVYVPGGKALYPSSVLMNAIPAKVAGVRRVVMCTPTATGEINPYLLVAADIAGIDELYRIGGVHAIAAMAFGTKTIVPVDKIIGPGNLFVATAKRLVYGQVDIDMTAGPSELLVIADQSDNPKQVAADLLCEAEHDEEARVYLVTTTRLFARQVVDEVGRQLTHLTRRRIAAKSIKQHAVAFVVDSLEEAIEVSNRIAPEHVALMMDQPMDYLDRVRHAGAIFLGRFTPPAVADYVAGPNHVLPTGGTARFFSALSLDDFVKKSNIVSYSRNEWSSVRKYVACLSRMEGLDAHGKSMESRLE